MKLLNISAHTQDSRTCRAIGQTMKFLWKLAIPFAMGLCIGVVTLMALSLVLLAGGSAITSVMFIVLLLSLTISISLGICLLLFVIVFQDTRCLPQDTEDTKSIT